MSCASGNSLYYTLESVEAGKQEPRMIEITDRGAEKVHEFLASQQADLGVAGLRVGVRDDPRLRALALGAGLIPPRTMHSDDDARLLLQAAAGARRVVEIGVYEGASARALVGALPDGAELHLIDPFGHAPDALPAG